MRPGRSLWQPRAFVASALPLIVVASVAGFVLVGRYAARPRTSGFDWELASIFGTAIGTFLLALATGVLALSTSRDVSATRELAQIARAEHDERNPAPLLAGIPIRIDVNTGTPVLFVDLANLGGLATRIQLTATISGVPADATCLVTPAYLSVLGGPGERVEVPLSFKLRSGGSYDDLTVENFRLDGTYRDRRGRPAHHRILDMRIDNLPDPA